MKTNPKEFDKFCECLPKNIVPHFIPICANAKEPDVKAKQSWKAPKYKLSRPAARKRLKQGKNVGIVANEEIAIIDIDDLKKARRILPDWFYTTLNVTTRTGRLHLYFKPKKVDNADVAEILELRAKDRYVLTPGSYVPPDNPDQPGLYKVTNPANLKVLPKFNLPGELKRSTSFSKPTNTKEYKKRGKQLIDEFPKLKKLWLGKGKGKGDTSQSGYEFSLVLKALNLGITDDADLVALLLSRPKSKGLTKNKGKARESYLKKTISKARERFKKGEPTRSKQKSRNYITPEQLQEFKQEFNFGLEKGNGNLEQPVDLVLPEKSFPKDGWLAKFIDYTRGLTDANDELLLFAGLFILSSTVGKLAGIPHFGDRLLYPNLWISILAPHGRHRKSTVCSIIRKFLSKSGQWAILPDEVTPERLIAEMQNHECTGSFVISELANFLGLANRSYQGGFKPMLTNWYDVPHKYQRKKITGKSEQEKVQTLYEPYLTIFGGSTMVWFLDSTDPGDVLGGFFSRFIFIPILKKRREEVFWPQELPTADIMEENTLVENLHQRITPMKTFIENNIGDIKKDVLTLSFERGAQEVFSEWAKSMNRKMEQMTELMNKIGGFGTRLQSIAKKIALLLEISSERWSDKLEQIQNFSLDSPKQNCTVLSKKSMLQSIYITEEIWKTTRDLVSKKFIHDPFAQKMQSTVELIYEKKGISREDLIRQLRMPAKELNELISTLIQGDLIQKVKVRQDGPGRPTTHYLPAKHEKESNIVEDVSK